MSGAKKWLILCWVLFVGPAGLAVGEEVPEVVKKNAAAATKILGDQVLRTNYSYVFQRMYPRHKARVAKMVGGEEKLAAQLAKLPEQLKKDGIVILSFDVGEPKSAFRVPEYREWLVFVPTKKVYIVPDRQRGVNRKIESHGFQVAVSKGDGRDWYFIDGSKLKVSQLRSLFPSLPEDVKKLNLPLVSQKEIK